MDMSANARLNPYYNGRYSPRYQRQIVKLGETVLILIIMEDTLRGMCRYKSASGWWVLILIIMEDTLRVKAAKTNRICI